LAVLACVEHRVDAGNGLPRAGSRSRSSGGSGGWRSS
jgi:hypothetical protein